MVDFSPNYRIKTESGTVYLLDTEARMITRQAGEDAGELDYDNETFHYVSLADELIVGQPFRALWDDNGRMRMRTSTPMVSVERL